MLQARDEAKHAKGSKLKAFSKFRFFFWQKLSKGERSVAKCSKVDAFVSFYFSSRYCLRTPHALTGALIRADAAGIDRWTMDELGLLGTLLASRTTALVVQF